MLAQAVARGARVRSISDAEFLALPGALSRIRRDVAAGEEARMFPSLPFKMIVVDRRVGLIPLNLRQPEGGPILLVRASALLDALCALFESFWERSTPLMLAPDGMLREAAASKRGADAAAELIALLASGLNDKTIEHELGISRRTFTRRFAALMKELGAATRFHAGWLAGRQSGPDEAGGR